MNILITGAAGFLGSHLANYHLNQGHYVFGIDDFSTSSMGQACSSSLGLKSAHFVQLVDHPRFQLCKADITKQDFLLYTNNKKFDLILNFACPASPPKYQAMPIHTMRTCTVGLMNVLDVAQTNNCKVVHASTSEIYGDPDISPQPEEYCGHVNSYGPRACYDEGKRAAEAICYDYNNLGVDVRVVRIFNTYGPHMDPNDGRVVSNFIWNALHNKPLHIFGNGEQTRSFCYVDDLIDAITRITSIDHLSGPINIGNDAEFSINELGNKIADILGKKLQFVYLDSKIDDPKQRRPDLTKAKKILGWEPKVCLEDGIRTTIDWFKNM